VRSTVLMIVSFFSTCPATRSAPPDNEIQFKLVNGFAIVAKGEIAGLKNLNFLIDTGAVPSVISTRTATHIGATGKMGSFAVASNGSTAARDHVSTTPYATIKDVHLGWAHAPELPVVIVDLHGLESTLGIPIDGIIGLDIFAGQDFSIDYRHHTLTKGLSGRTQHSSPAEIKTASGAPYWTVQVDLRDQQLRFLVDTGADNLAAFEDNPKRPLPGGHDPQAKTRSGAPSSILQTGIAISSVVHPAGDLNSPQSVLALDDLSLKKLKILKLARPAGALGELDGLLGPTALGVTRLEFDWANKTVLWDSK
jgi:predicted aspartyl protease